MLRLIALVGFIAVAVTSELADIKDYPYQLALLNGGGFVYCGASIISERHALTAAHCTKDRSHEDIKLRAGSNDKTTGGTVYQPSAIAQHPSYDSYSRANDIAVLTVETPFEFGPNVQPIGLPTAGQTIEEATLVVATGWSKGGVGSRALQKVNLSTMDFPMCKRIFPMVRESSLCVNRETPGTCMVEPGGPIVDKQTNTQLGVVSWGITCGVTPRVCTNLANPEIREFIENAVKG